MKLVIGIAFCMCIFTAMVHAQEAPAGFSNSHLQRQVSPAKGAQPVNAERFKAAMDVLEAVSRYQFRVYEPRRQKTVKVYFLTIPITYARNMNNDLNAELYKKSDELLKRFEDHTPPVKSVFHAISSAVGTVVRDDQTGERGVDFSCGPIRRLTKRRAVVEGGFYERDFSSANYIYYLTLVRDEWVVKRAVMLWSEYP